MSSKNKIKLKDKLKNIEYNKEFGWILGEKILKEQIDLGLSKEAIRKKFLLSNRTAHNTWKYAKSKWPVETRKVSSSAYRKNMLGNTRGTRPLSIKVSRDILLECFRKHKKIDEIKKELGLTDFLLHKNIVENKLQKEYTNFRSHVFKSLTISESSIDKIKLLYPEIEILFDKTTDFSIEDGVKLHKFYIELVSLAQNIKRFGRCINKRLKSRIEDFNSLYFTSNIGEVLVAEILYSHNINFFQNYKLQNYYYDFYLKDFNTIIEVDGSSHLSSSIKKKDLEKELVAKNNNIEIIRIKWLGDNLEYGEFHKFMQDKIYQKDRKKEDI